ncbi:MAG TPA: DUF2147 domain-containing protein [Gammaproteobacteria bacterium]|nr:DUF2147 domain-containing protein [Gammaproteobacteria bacterium]
MKKIIIVLFSLFLSPSLFAANSQPATDKIDGLWEVRYDASDTPSSHIRITTQANGEVIGVIEEAYPRPGVKDDSPNCTKCTGENKDKPIKGLKVLWGMQPDGKNQWSGGHVLDAETGKIYSGKMTLTHDGNELDLRGYVLTPMFGDTSTWRKIGN